MTNLKRNSHLENEFSLLTEMEMLHVFGGDGNVTNAGSESGIGSGSGSGSGC